MGLVSMVFFLAVSTIPCIHGKRQLGSRAIGFERSERSLDIGDQAVVFSIDVRIESEIIAADVCKRIRLGRGLLVPGIQVVRACGQRIGRDCDQVTCLRGLFVEFRFAQVGGQRGELVVKTVFQVDGGGQRVDPGFGFRPLVIVVGREGALIVGLLRLGQVGLHLGEAVGELLPCRGDPLPPLLLGDFGKGVELGLFDNAIE